MELASGKLLQAIGEKGRGHAQRILCPFAVAELNMKHAAQVYEAGVTAATPNTAATPTRARDSTATRSRESTWARSHPRASLSGRTVVPVL